MPHCCESHPLSSTEKGRNQRAACDFLEYNNITGIILLKGSDLQLPLTHMHCSTKLDGMSSLKKVNGFKLLNKQNIHEFKDSLLKRQV